MFITFEGAEGSGKTTQVRLLANALTAFRLPVLATREPGGTALGERLRALLLDSRDPLSAETEAYLMTAARAEHVRTVIRPALASGRLVLCDRYVDSTLAYQGAGRGLPLDDLTDLQRLAVGGTLPDLTILLDVPAELGLARRMQDGESNRFDRETLAFHERVADWYRRRATADPARWRIVDAANSQTLVHTEVTDIVMRAIDRARMTQSVESAQ